MRCINKVQHSRLERFFAILFTIIIVLGAVKVPIQAAEPQVSVDESVYVTMDYYGKITDTSIVKGCDLNKNYQFVDYGNYSKVMNMSTNDEPKLYNDRVEWDLPEETGRFYFECVPKDIEHALPWSVDVSYNLNGIPVRAEELAGASGLIQVDIKAKPNEEAGEYYRHNMMLTAITLVDMEDVRSFRADGAQMQTVGSKKAAIFMAMPGEDGEFSYQIGSDNFESTGTFFLMAPITLSQLDQISDLKDAKQRTEDAFDALNASLDIVLTSLAKMPEGLRTTQQALNTLDQAREVIYDSEDGLSTRIDKLNDRLYGVSVTLRRLGSDLDDLDDEDILEDLGSSLSDSGRVINDVSSSINAVNNRLTRVKDALDDYVQIPNAPSQEEANAMTKALKDSIAQLEGYISSLHPTDEQKAVLEKLKATLQGIEGSDIQASHEIAAQIKNEISGGLEDLVDMSDALNGMISMSDSLIGEIYDMLDDVRTSGVITSTKRVVTSTALLTDELRNTSMYVQQTVKDCKELLNEGLKQLNQGANQVIDTTIEGLDQTGAIKQYKDTIKQTIDDEWDRLANDLGLFDIDVDADKISFTSDKNPMPDSIQIILRTAEISIPDEIEDESDLETGAQNQGVWQRIKDVFIRIWNAIQQIFVQ